MLIVLSILFLSYWIGTPILWAFRKLDFGRKRRDRDFQEWYEQFKRGIEEYEGGSYND